MLWLLDLPVLSAALTVVLSVTITTDASAQLLLHVRAAAYAAHISLTLMWADSHIWCDWQWWWPRTSRIPSSAVLSNAPAIHEPACIAPKPQFEASL